MIFCGPAEKVTIRIDANDAAWVTICEALTAFLCPKDVCCLQVEFLEDAVEIGFLGRKGKVQVLMDTASLIAPSAVIYAERTMIVHAKAGPRIDVIHERADWEASVQFRNAVAVEREGPGAFSQARRISGSRAGGSRPS